MKRILSFVIIATVALGLSACSNMSKQNKNTAIGATVGAVGGAILTDGSALGTVGGAAIGGIIGHQVKK
ncbi:TPA: osmotically-inducible lipoprotein OsmB [Providencia alcalifaciens]|jgi:osmotically inducible lipoprotein OsmB|uniref:Osmotically-inducible lipoprotein OsmB n=4 Tax=Providencia TaxID=586 RepID=A0A291EEE2_9GAMM|nr:MULTISPECIES: osmotically-inducible lipoprotein OsmB [Providencia]MTC74378.1 osmotically-inducible lipoprotein OsmB [Providencia sp. wls1919]ATG17428.1 osmotically-inducible lipoprotein OsmB [Providencia alcalifaciens]EEB44809.1 osmotically-inducible lipoprotein B [Providencia alcalifaciens DSM 30120]EKT66746.1 lipoprotein [Providencia alcalifaciens Dmel2]ETS98104.1 osmotically-inducible lipoprotein B [Providencia alcalifaciens PAL-3]